jgi:hypothetical protein
MLFHLGQVASNDTTAATYTALHFTTTTTPNYGQVQSTLLEWSDWKCGKCQASEPFVLELSVLLE